MSKPEQISIETLLAGCRNHDRKAQEKMYRYFYPHMMPVCMGYAGQVSDAVDIYNRSFLKVFTKLHEYNGDGAFAGWVRKIIVHTAIDYIRREEKHKNHVDIEDMHHLSANANHPLDHLLSDDVLQVMQKLPPIQRLVVNLYIIEGYQHNEIAAQLNIRPGTSKWHLSEGRKQLKKLLTKAGITY